MALPKLLQKLFTNGGAGDKLNQDIIPDIPYSKVTDAPSVDSALSSTSENPVQNKVVKSALDGKLSTSGGTMTGDIIFSSSATKIANAQNKGGKVEVSETGAALLSNKDDYEGGATLLLRSSTYYSDQKGYFYLISALSASQRHDLVGKPDGSLTWGGTFSATTLKATSDKRKKMNITKTSADLSSLSAYRYKFKEPSEVDKGFHVGLIAQEVEKILPEAVSKDEKGFLTLDYNAVVAVLVDEVNQLKFEIKQLQAKLS